MAPILRFIISSGSKKKKPRCVCLNEANASHWHKMWTEFSSSKPHFLQAGLLLSPITYRCLFRVLCPVRRPVTTLDCVLLKDNNWAFVARIGPWIRAKYRVDSWSPLTCEEIKLEGMWNIAETFRSPDAYCGHIAGGLLSPALQTRQFSSSSMYSDDQLGRNILKIISAHPL